jgi:chromosome segregation ATPase
MEGLLFEAKINTLSNQNGTLKEQDEKFVAIQDLIQAKRGFLLDKQKRLRAIESENQFLDSVKNDYAKYYSYIKEQKNDQIKALELLNEYIKDLSISGKLTKHNLEDAEAEQARILREVKSIKKSLDSLMEGTD